MEEVKMEKEEEVKILEKTDEEIREMIEMIKRQTSLENDDEIRQQLTIFDYKVESVIRSHLNLNTTTAASEKPVKSINQEIYSQLRKKLGHIDAVGAFSNSSSTSTVKIQKQGDPPKQQPVEKYYILVTAANSPKFSKPLLQLLDSVYKFKPKFLVTYIFDLGLDQETLDEIATRYKDQQITVRKFPFGKYPPHYDINVNSGCYAWKSACIYSVMNEQYNAGKKWMSQHPDQKIVSNPLDNKILLWCDSHNVFVDQISNLGGLIDKCKIYSSVSINTVKKWTHPKTLEYFKIDENNDVLKFPNRNAAFIGFRLDNNAVCKFIHEWSHYCSVPECICPTGSDRTNHRQDQSIFTLLFYEFTSSEGNPNDCIIVNQQVGFVTHQYLDGVVVSGDTEPLDEEPVNEEPVEEPLVAS